MGGNGHVLSWYSSMDDSVPGHGGCTMMQIFHILMIGTVHSYPMKTEKKVRQAFEDHICKVGMPVGLKSDNAKLELHGHTKDIWRLHSVGDTQLEPHCQHQNQAERKI